MKKICILVDRPRISAHAEGKILWGYDLSLIEEKCARAGILMDRITIESISQTPREPTQADYANCIARLNQQNYEMIVPLDEKALQFTTGRASIWKWHLSPLDTLEGFSCRRVVPTFHPDQMKKEWYLGLYFEMALRRANKYASTEPWLRKETRYALNPSYEETIDQLERLLKNPPEYFSLDIETGRNQVNTFGVAWSPNDAIAIKLLPGEMPTDLHHKVWEVISRVCESEVPKVMQNGIYERLYLSRYGIQINNFTHDTMCAMKFLWPELEKGLDNVGRLYTMEPYWKDDGRVASAEGKQKDWNNIRDWPKHLEYNCKDTSNTLIAMHAQRADLKSRNLLELFDSYIARLYRDCTYEMGAIGLPLNRDTQQRLITEYEAKSAELTKALSKEINPRSSKQKIKLLQDKGLKLPKKKDHKKGGMRDSADELTLKKLRCTYPDDTDIKALLEISKIEKALSSYLRVRTFPDNRIRFQMDAHGTETGRFSCGLDPWGRGFNAQTMNDYTKSMIEFTPESDRVFMEFDLDKAETWFVAYDAVEETLLRMLHNKEDIHSHVAASIYGCSVDQVVAEYKQGMIDKRQLGKKSGHGANYDMGVNTFIDSCLKELDLVLTKPFASQVLEGYHRLFPGVRRWHALLRNKVYRERCLRNPLGRVRYFYGRPDDNTYREAFAYGPQSTIPDIINHMMLGMLDKRTEGAFDFWLHLQVHDSLLISCKRDQVEKIGKFALNPEPWHPNVILPAGKLIIPSGAKFGACLGNLEKLTLN